MKYYDISKGELVDPDTPTLGEKFSIAGMDRDLNIQTASLPYGTQGTYGAPEETPMPNWRDLIREEGIQVGPQVKDGGLIGGRVGFQDGTKAPAAIKIDQANPNLTRDQLRKLYKDAGLTIEGKILKRKRPFMPPHGKKTGLSQEMIEKVKMVLDDPINYPTKEKMMKALGYRTDPRPGRTFGMTSFDRLLDEYEKATGTKINRVERFPTSFRYKGSEISKQIGDAAEEMIAKGNDVNVKQLARLHLKEKFLKDPDGARAEIRRILETEGIEIDTKGRTNIKGDREYIAQKRRDNKIKYAAKMAGKEYVAVSYTY